MTQQKRSMVSALAMAAPALVLLVGCSAPSAQDTPPARSFEVLTGALLTTADLPPGWTALVAEKSDVTFHPMPTESAFTDELCEPQRELGRILGVGASPIGPLVEFHPTVNAENFEPPEDFRLGALAPGLEHSIIVSDEAARVMELARRSMTGCSGPEDPVTTVMPFPRLGDDLLATTERLGALTSDEVLVRRGDAVISLRRSADAATYPSTVLALDLERLATVALARYDALQAS